LKKSERKRGKDYEEKNASENLSLSLFLSPVFLLLLE
jgi:hypothetical protein